MKSFWSWMRHQVNAISQAQDFLSAVNVQGASQSSMGRLKGRDISDCSSLDCLSDLLSWSRWRIYGFSAIRLGIVSAMIKSMMSAKIPGSIDAL